MRVPFAAVVVVSVALSPGIGEASPITPESMPHIATADGRTSGASIADSGAASGYSALFNESGDPILLLTSLATFDPQGSHDKLRGGPTGGGIVFVPTGGPAGGNSWSFGGPWGGGAQGGSSSGPPAFGSFTLLSIVTQSPPPDPGLNLGPGFGFGSSSTFSFEPCCEDETPTVPEPSTLLLAGSGLLLGLKRVMGSRP